MVHMSLNCWCWEVVRKKKTNREVQPGNACSECDLEYYRQYDIMPYTYKLTSPLMSVPYCSVHTADIIMIFEFYAVLHLTHTTRNGAYGLKVFGNERLWKKENPSRGHTYLETHVRNATCVFDCKCENVPKTDNIVCNDTYKYNQLSTSLILSINWIIHRPWDRSYPGISKNWPPCKRYIDHTQ